MTRSKTVFRSVSAFIAVGVLLAVLFFTFGRHRDAKQAVLGPTQRRIDTVVDLGDDTAARCEHPELKRGDPAPRGTLRAGSTACVLVGVRDSENSVRWFFIARATGDGTVRVPKPVQVGHSAVALSNGALVSIGANVSVRCSPDPNARFESWIAEGLATAGYIDADGALVAIDCDASATT